MKTSHTAGPWSANGNVVTAQHDMRLPVAICVSQEDNRQTVDAAAKTREEAIANATLIASCPDLLNALEIAEATIQRLAPDGSRATQGTRDVISAALKKAKGQK